MVTVRSAIRIRTTLINFVTIKDFSEIRSIRYMGGGERRTGRQNERKRSEGRERDFVCVCEEVSVTGC